MASSEHADTLIIGAGAAGCVVARRLAESASGSIVLLEAMLAEHLAARRARPS